MLYEASESTWSSMSAFNLGFSAFAISTVVFVKPKIGA